MRGFYIIGQLIDTFFLHKTDFLKTAHIRNRNSLTVFKHQNITKKRGQGLTSLTLATKANTFQICKILIHHCGTILTMGGHDLKKLESKLHRDVSK